MAVAVRWTEVNVVPADPGRPGSLLNVVDPIVHEQLRDRIDVWFYFWEPEVRLRLRYAARNADADAAVVKRPGTLDRAVQAGQVGDSYEGAHGQRGATYTGEAAYYGDEL